MIRRPPRSTQGVSSAASDVYKRQIQQASLSNFLNRLSRKFQQFPNLAQPDIVYQLFINGKLTADRMSLTYIEYPMYSALILSLIHISEPTRPLYISYAVFCLKKKKIKPNILPSHG
eukprot:TRINITY_DN19143_c0_g1_i1.p2 TRINITY_DN19143_c0_g1~~TRINITY_DN19143_c0_g1_i1.p2  ORF type:complete len:117 (+),score=18.92 TRINITY_DN19143_c0_g1_i1:112-462(+)